MCIRDRYSFAQMATQDQEAAWNAVAEYFPPSASAENLRHSRLAIKGLARYYVDNQRYSEALLLYQKLAAVEDTEREFQLTGLIGQAVVYDRQGDQVKVHEQLAKISPYLNSLPPNLGNFLRTQLDELLKNYAKQGE